MAWFLGSAADLFPKVLPWLGALLGLLVVGGIVLYAVRKLAQPEERVADVGFTLQDLRDLHRAGELTDDEFARAKAAMIEQVQRAATAAAAESADEAHGV